MNRDKIQSLSDDDLNKVATNAFRALSPPLRNGFSPVTHLTDAWEILENQLSEAGGCFSTNADGWTCYFAEEDEIVSSSPMRAICMAFLIEISEMLNDDGTWTPEPEDSEEAAVAAV